MIWKNRTIVIAVSFMAIMIGLSITTFGTEVHGQNESEEHGENHDPTPIVLPCCDFVPGDSSFSMS